MATEIEERRVEVAALQIGMFVCRLDRPWEGTPFLLQGIDLKSEDDLRSVRALCNFVFIDARREIEREHVRLQSLPPNILKGATIDVPASPAAAPIESAASARRQSTLLTLPPSDASDARFNRVVVYRDTASTDDELPRARQALRNVAEMVDRIYVDVTSGRDLSVDHVEQAVRPLVASVLRNADTFLCMEGLRRHDNYSYGHSISCSALAAAFGRHMGLHEDVIIRLAAGGLLMDVGKTRVAESLLNYAGSLSSDKVEVVRTHVNHGLDILAAARITDPDVEAIVRTHHERHDGSGYPAQLSGSFIPLAGRMLGIIDTYDAMTNVRPYRPAVSRHHALQHIYLARDSLFQGELVEQFQVCLGVYPTGSLVELNTGEVAVVMTQNQARRLKPSVLILSTANKQPLREFRILNLLEQPKSHYEITIARSLAVGEYGVDAAEHFLQ